MTESVCPWCGAPLRPRPSRYDWGSYRAPIECRCVHLATPVPTNPGLAAERLPKLLGDDIALPESEGDID
jgi:hypothetical protein